MSLQDIALEYRGIEPEEPDAPPQPRCPKDATFLPYQPNARAMVVVDWETEHGWVDDDFGGGYPTETITNERKEERPVWQCKRCGMQWDSSDVYRD